MALPAGANGVVYLSQDHTQLVHVGGASGSTRTDFDAWIKPDQERIQWVSKWGADKPWCSMVVPKPEVDSEANPRLACIGLDGNALPSVELPGVFTHAEIDPSGKSVVLYNKPGSGTREGLLLFEREVGPGTLFNPRLAAVVDLVPGTVRTLSVEGFGAELEGLRFPEQVSGDNQVEVGGKMRRLASFWARRELVLIDLDDPELSQIAVSVRTFEENAPLLRLIPSGTGVEEPLLLIAGRTNDIDQIRLRPREGEPSRLDADYSILSTVAPARDLELVEIDQEPWLLSATRFGLSMIHLKSSRETLVDAMGSLKEIRTYVDKSGKTMVLGLPEAGNSIFTIDPAKALTSLGRQPTTHQFGHGSNRVLSLDNSRVAVLGGSSLTVVDLESGKKTPLAGIDGTNSVTYSGGDHLYLFARTGQEEEQGISLVRVKLSTMVPETQALAGRIDGAPGFIKLNDGKGLAFPQYRDGSNDFGVGYIDVNSPSLAEFTTTWFSME